jgi:hypothetical protein
MYSPGRHRAGDFKNSFAKSHWSTNNFFTWEKDKRTITQVTTQDNNTPKIPSPVPSLKSTKLGTLKIGLMVADLLDFWFSVRTAVEF